MASVKTFDITQPSNFNLVAHPDFRVPGLAWCILPVGFVLLGLLKEEKGGGLEAEEEQQIKKNNMRNKSKNNYFVIITVISLLGILSHDEIYLLHHNGVNNTYNLWVTKKTFCLCCIFSSYYNYIFG